MGGGLGGKYISCGEDGFIQHRILKSRRDILHHDSISYQGIGYVISKYTDFLCKVSQFGGIRDKSDILAYSPDTVGKGFGNSSSRKTPRWCGPWIIGAGDKDKRAICCEAREMREDIGKGIPMSFVRG